MSSNVLYSCVGDFVQLDAGCVWDVWTQLFDGSDIDYKTIIHDIKCVLELNTAISPLPPQMPSPPHPPSESSRSGVTVSSCRRLRRFRNKASLSVPNTFHGRKFNHIRHSHRMCDGVCLFDCDLLQPATL